MIQYLWKTLSSLRLTVWCLALSILLVFVGTVAQADEGLYQAQERYFKQWIVWAPTLFGHKLPLLLPGGYLLGTVLLVNLLGAHTQRFQWSAKKLGINLTHFGIIVLLLGQLVTDLFSVESYLRLREGESKTYTESHREHELVFATDTTPGSEKVVSIPESLLTKPGAEISHPDLPFSLRVNEYKINSQVLSRTQLLETAGRLTAALAKVEGQYGGAELPALAATEAESPGRLEVWRASLTAAGASSVADIAEAAKSLASQPEREARLRTELKERFQKEMLARWRQQGGAMKLAAERADRKEPLTADSLQAPATQGAGSQVVAFPLPEMRTMDMKNLPHVVLEILDAGKPSGTWLFSPMLEAQELEGPHAKWRGALRAERYYHPFSVKLLTTTHEKYQGTEIPKNFQSRVRLEHPVRSESREVDIYMNNPLRYEGLTYFQYQMDRDEQHGNVGISTLQVVRNPSWLGPYLGCILVGLGMTVQFLYHLVGFVTKRRTA